MLIVKRFLTSLRFEVVIILINMYVQQVQFAHTVASCLYNRGQKQKFMELEQKLQ